MFLYYLQALTLAKVFGWKYVVNVTWGNLLAKIFLPMKRFCSSNARASGGKVMEKSVV